jgi:protein gp37
MEVGRREHHDLDRMDRPDVEPCERVFVNSMSDLFHENVPDEFIASVFGVMCVASQHTFQILTQRPERMRQFMTDYLRARERLGWASGFYRHVWLGVSVEDQATADERIPILLQTPAAVRFISAEPLLGPMDLTRSVQGVCDDGCSSTARECDEYRRRGKIACCPECRHPKLDWVIVGGESGPRARPCDLAWIRSITEQCQAAGVPVFVKQLGSQWYDRAARCGDFADVEFPVDLRVREFPNG